MMIYKKNTYKKSGSKYFNKKVYVDGIKFDSKAEAMYYSQLKLEEKGDELVYFQVKPKFVLQEKPRVTFTPDFLEKRVNRSTGSVDMWIVDVKAKNNHQTPSFKLKWKWLQGNLRNEKHTFFKTVPM